MTGPVLPVLPVTAGQARLQRGGRVTLVTRRAFPSTVVPATGPGVWLAFPGTEDLAGLLTASGANAVQLGFTITGGAGPTGGGVLVHLDPAGPAPALLGAVASFTHEGRAPAPFRLTLPVARVGAGPVTMSFLPVGSAGSPGRAGSPGPAHSPSPAGSPGPARSPSPAGSSGPAGLPGVAAPVVSATLLLVLSTVER